MSFPGPTLHPILVQCPTASIRNAWLSSLNDLVRATRCYSNVPSVQNTTQVGYHSLPFVRLVKHFKALHELGLIVTKSVEFIREFKSRNVAKERGSDHNVLARSASSNPRFRKHACVSNINVVVGGGLLRCHEDEFVTKSLSNVNECDYKCRDSGRGCVSLPRDFSWVGGSSGGGRRRVLMRQDAFDFGGSSDSVDSGLGEQDMRVGGNECFSSEAVCVVKEFGTRTYVNGLYACWALNLGIE